MCKFRLLGKSSPMDSLQRFRSCRTPQSRKSPKHLPSPKSLLPAPSPAHKRSSPSLVLRFIAAVPPGYGLSLGSRKKSPRKCLRRRAASRQQHRYSTSVSTAADSAVLELGKSAKVEEMNVILTPSSHRITQQTREQGCSLIEEELEAYSSTQLSAKVQKLDYVQCETLTLPFYSVTPSRLMPRTQQHALARVCDERNFTPDRSNSPPLDRILHPKYLQAVQTYQQTDPTDTPIRLNKPRRLPKQRGVSLIDQTQTAIPKPCFRRRLKRETSEKPVLCLPHLGHD